MKEKITTVEKKLKAKDFINIGIFSVLYIIIFFVCIMLTSLTIYTQPFGMALVGLLAGPVYMLLRTKTPKPGAISLFAAVYALVMLLTGAGWVIPISVFVGAAIAESITYSGKKKSYTRETVGYMVITTAAAIGSYVPLLYMKDQYTALAAGNGVDGDFMMQLVNFVSGPYLILAILVTAVFAVLGALLARTILKKHFVKAGLIEGVK